ncbi:SH3 domain-containing protein [Roseovarius sp. D0-M9]|uniref:SH3 domain-containing protein n=1 Tax=Roseovarius sp. D0-M9 TaxID=3127117 RepID=UPI003010207D
MHISSKSGIGIALVSLLATFAPSQGTAQFDGHGPDAWQVTGVASDDWLNLRMGPSTDYPIIGSFPSGATGLTMTTCVPFMAEGQGIMLSQAERNLLDLPPRWCLMSDGQTHGWAAAQFLMEATGPAMTDESSDKMISDAVLLVQRLYARHEQAMRGEALDPLGAARSMDFFMADIAYSLSQEQWQADPLYDAQDTDISGFRVVPDPDQPMLRGMITVRAEFTNFGRPQSVMFNLRADPDQPGTPVRIMRIDHGEWSVP